MLDDDEPDVVKADNFASSQMKYAVRRSLDEGKGVSNLDALSGTSSARKLSTTRKGSLRKSMYQKLSSMYQDASVANDKK